MDLRAQARELGLDRAAVAGLRIRGEQLLPARDPLLGRLAERRLPRVARERDVIDRRRRRVRGRGRDRVARLDLRLPWIDERLLLADEPHVIAGEHALRELGIGMRDAGAVTGPRDRERAEREPIVELLAGRRIGRDHLVQQLELRTGADAVLRAEIDVDVLAVDGEDDGLTTRLRECGRATSNRPRMVEVRIRSPP